MKFLDLKQTIKTNIFSFEDVEKYFPDQNTDTLRIQLSRLGKQKLILRIRRGLYCFQSEKINDFALANILYTPSYISTESALAYYGIIPDIPQSTTSVTTTTSKKIKTIFGNYHYLKIQKKLFFGFKSIKEGNSYIKIAKPEKALLDYLYLRKITQISDLRLNLKEINIPLYKKYLKSYPDWVKKIQL